MPTIAERLPGLRGLGLVRVHRTGRAAGAVVARLHAEIQKALASRGARA
jgi:hypothetical protein